MGKKRKAGGRPFGEAKAPKDEDSKMRVTTFEDVADSEDEFHINRDKILLEEEPASKRLKKWKEQGVFSLLTLGTETFD
jgi:U3 small nucleolar RNA-associated protein 3